MRLVPKRHVEGYDSSFESQITQLPLGCMLSKRLERFTKQVASPSPESLFQSVVRSGVRIRGSLRESRVFRLLVGVVRGVRFSWRD